MSDDIDLSELAAMLGVTLDPNKPREAVHAIRDKLDRLDDEELAQLAARSKNSFEFMLKVAAMHVSRNDQP